MWMIEIKLYQVNIVSSEYAASHKFDLESCIDQINTRQSDTVY